MSMEPEQKFKRETAYKISISDIINGNFIRIDNKSYVVTPFGLNINRARIFGVVVYSQIYKQDQNEENIDIARKDYGFLVLDDGTETIRVKVWGDDIDKYKLQSIEIGDNLDIIGRVREYKDEIFIMPEIILKIDDPNWELVRELEKIELKQQFKNKKIVNISNSEILGEKPTTSSKKNKEKLKNYNIGKIQLIKINNLTLDSKKVNLIGKCTEIGEIREVANENKVMEITIGDETGTVVLSVWNDDIEIIKKDESYRIINGYISKFQDKVTLNTGKYGQIEISEDKIKNVKEENIFS
ncbi:MAG: OB-fold nucleic acid binding domain-containing protein [Candidatus Helarchaeota archaeon]